MTTHNGCTPDWREIRYDDGVKLWVCDNCGAVRKSRPRVGKISQHTEDVVPGPTTETATRCTNQEKLTEPK